MQASVQRDFNWQRHFIPQMKAICGRHLIGEAPAEEDARRNTDLIVLRIRADEDLRVACRVRGSEKYLKSYGDQFTIRCARDSGWETELAKVRQGFGDYLLYCFARRRRRVPTWVPRLDLWTLADLDVFRTHYRDGMSKPVPNGDGTWFMPFRWIDFPPEFVIATSRTEQGAMVS